MSAAAPVRFRRRSLPGIELALIDCSGRAFAKHAHDEFVLSVNLAGRETVWLDGRTFEADAGDLTLYNPAQVQGSTAQSERWLIASLHLSPGSLAALAGVSAETIFDRRVLTGGRFARWIADLVLRGTGSRADAAEIAEAAADGLGPLLAAHGSARPPTGRAQPPLRRVAERLLTSIDDEPPSLEELAADEGLTAVQLVRAFRRTHGMPPIAWLYQQRLGRARRMLAEGVPAAAVAAALGFADQAHLTRRFRAAFAVTPATWAAGVK